MTQATVVVIAHGSRAEVANDAHRQVATDLDQRLGSGVTVVPAFLELAEPDIGSAIDAAVVDGAIEVLLLPHFLYPGRHVGTDIPAIVDDARRRHPMVTVTLLEATGADPAMADLVATQIQRALPRP